MNDDTSGTVEIGTCGLLENAQNILNELQDRLNPILAPVEEGQGGEKATPCSSMLEKMRLLHDQLRTILNRVQL